MGGALAEVIAEPTPAGVAAVVIGSALVAIALIAGIALGVGTRWSVRLSGAAAALAAAYGAALLAAGHESALVIAATGVAATLAATVPRRVERSSG
ncbi:MAG: hypothetical protein ACJ767_10420 [Chloroflexota bacterium]